MTFGIGLPIEVNAENESNIRNMHNAMLTDMKAQFGSALSKDQIYKRPSGFLNEMQFWMLGVQIEYFINSVLRFDHKDFMKAMKYDLGPILGDVGLWCIKDLLDNAKQRKDPEMKKKYQVAFDIVEKYNSNGFETLGIEKKYNFTNKFGPKKCPD